MEDLDLQRFCSALIGHQSLHDEHRFVAAILNIVNRDAARHISYILIRPELECTAVSDYFVEDIFILGMVRMNGAVDFVCSVWKPGVRNADYPKNPKLRVYATQSEFVRNQGFYHNFVLNRYKYQPDVLKCIQIFGRAIERQCKTRCCCVPLYALNYAIILANTMPDRMPVLRDTEDLANQLRLKFTKILLTQRYYPEDFII